MADHLGKVLDGDQLLYVLAVSLHAEGRLAGPVIGTVMSNLGLERALRKLGIGFERAAVGDRYVMAKLRETGGVLGGETSGHILCLDRTTTGDGLVSALQVLAVMKRTGKTLSELAAPMQKYPQVLLNVKVAQRFDPVSVPSVAQTIRSLETRMGEEGRIVLRASGTEPVIRVMVEASNANLAQGAAEELAAAVRAAA
jgi:phosphoglucosamine mutase